MSQAERAIVGHLLVDPSRIPEVARALQPEHFAVTRHRKTFSGMLELLREGRKVDAINLASIGIDAGDLALTDGTAIEDYINIVRDDYFRDLVHRGLENVLTLVEDGDSRPDIMAELSRVMHSITTEARDDRTYDAPAAVNRYQEIRATRKTQGVGLSYGIPQLDKFLQPAHGSDLVVVAARPSMGKTIVAEHIADHWAFGAENPVLFISIEMSIAQLMDRAVSRWSGVPSSDIVRGTLDEDQERLIELALEARKEVNIRYHDNAYATTDTVRAAAAEAVMSTGGLSGIVVDYLQLLANKGDNDNQRVSKISRDLKALAREHDCPVLVLSQLSRKSEYRSDQHPILSDLRDSGAIEQDADVVIGLFRDRDHEADDPFMDIDVIKNRQGPLSRVEVGFDGDHVRLVTDEATS